MAMECKEHYELPTFSSLEELEELLEEGMQDVYAGRVYTMEEVFGELEELSKALAKSDNNRNCKTKLEGN